MAKEKETKAQFTESMAIKITKGMDADIERISKELFPGFPGAYSVLVRQWLTKSIAEHDQAKGTERDRDMGKIASKRDRRVGR